MKMQWTAADSVIISSSTFCSMSVTCIPLHPLVQQVRSVVIIICLFHRWGLWSWSHLVWVHIFDLATKNGPSRSLELSTASLSEPLDHTHTPPHDKEQPSEMFNKMKN